MRGALCVPSLLIVNDVFAQAKMKVKARKSA
jgi:hypothetical protein